MSKIQPRIEITHSTLDMLYKHIDKIIENINYLKESDSRLMVQDNLNIALQNLQELNNAIKELRDACTYPVEPRVHVRNSGNQSVRAMKQSLQSTLNQMQFVNQYGSMQRRLGHRVRVVSQNRVLGRSIQPKYRKTTLKHNNKDSRSNARIKRVFFGGQVKINVHDIGKDNDLIEVDLKCQATTLREKFNVVVITDLDK